MRTRCIDCRLPATHRGRCAAHHSAFGERRSVRAHRAQRIALFRGQNAAASLRFSLREAEFGVCAACFGTFPLGAVDVDHIVPLSKGGADVAGNVQVLCKACHRVKTREDMRRG